MTFEQVSKTIGSAIPGEQPREQALPSETDEILAKLARQLETNARVQAVFGEPQTFHDRTIIPVARVTYGFGGGMGRGEAAKRRPAAAQSQEAATPESAAPGTGYGMGGGGGVRVEPVAIVEIGPKRTRIMPVVDANRIISRVFTAVFGFTLAALALKAFAERGGPTARRMVRPPFGSLRFMRARQARLWRPPQPFGLFAARMPRAA